ncbi:MAG TPA: efflux RND transporter periplasmic adaptor subunit [Thermoanaerobaculia bacterium]|nr:efflux RND transporter periplasmic adaptor subunit [Thermoanaerobaculia bacterium]
MSDVLTSLSKPKKSRKKLYIFIALALVVVIAVASAAVSRKREKPIPITTDKAFRKTITQLVTATGKIQPEIEVKISPEVSGEIIEIPVKEGQIVHKGDLLLKIKPDAYRAQVEAQEAALSSARAASVQHRAELDKADKDYRRARNLFERGLLSEADRNVAQTNFDIAHAALDSSLFEIKRADGALRQIQDALSKTVIFSPSDGTISALPSRQGERVVGTSQFAGTEVMRIADLNSMEARVNVNENDVVNVKVGDTALISVDAYPDRKIGGVVREIASTATTNNAGTQEQVTNFEVKIRISDRSVILRPGMSATADIATATVQSAVAVPIQSVTVRSTDSSLSPEEREKQRAKQVASEGDNRANVTNETQEKQKAREQREKLQRVVFVKSGGTVRMQRVETGIADSTYMEIKNGIKPGDEVVSGSYTAISRKLKDGSKVEIETPGKS